MISQAQRYKHNGDGLHDAVSLSALSYIKYLQICVDIACEVCIVCNMQ